MLVFNRSFFSTSLILLPALAGCLSALGFIFSTPLLFVVGLVLFIRILQNKSYKVSDRVGLSYGFSFYFIGLFWFFSVDDQYQASSFLVFFIFELLAILLLSLLFGVLALLVTLSPQKSRSSLVWFVAIVAPVFTLHEWVKTWYFSGFPWLQASHIFTGSFLKGWYAILGDIGVSFLFYFLVSVFCYVVFDSLKKSKIFIFLVVLSLFLLLSYQLGKLEFTRVDNTEAVVIHAVSGYATVKDKRSLEGRVARIRKYQDLTLVRKQVDISIWPESSTGTGVYDDIRLDVEEGFARLEQQNIEVFFGSYQQQGRQVKNSIFSSYKHKEMYTKQHLVPVGEYIPKWFSMFDVWIPGSFVSSTVSDFFNNKLLRHEGVRIAPSICYEVLFNNELRLRAKNANLLVGISNLEAIKPRWVKEYFFNLSRIRAMELQMPFVQSTNHGITGIISSEGKPIVKLSNKEGMVLAKINPKTGRTPFSYYGFFAVVGGAIVLLLFGFSYILYKMYSES